MIAIHVQFYSFFSHGARNLLSFQFYFYANDNNTNEKDDFFKSMTQANSDKGVESRI